MRYGNSIHVFVFKGLVTIHEVRRSAGPGLRPSVEHLPVAVGGGQPGDHRSSSSKLSPLVQLLFEV
jgi:hypothetical protein